MSTGKEGVCLVCKGQESQVARVARTSRVLEDVRSNGGGTGHGGSLF